jgi:hypothetical protein
MRLLPNSPSIILLLFCISAIAQQTEEKKLYDYFDNAVGIKNLGINNGPVHLDPYRSFDQSHRYLITKQYFTGDVIYDGQLYTNQSLKYDAFRDILVAKINEPNNSVGINLIQEKTAWFTFNNKKFVNLNLDHKNPQLAKGYYEEYAAGSKVMLYAKHHKEQIEVLTAEGVLYKYQPSYEFLIATSGNFSKIDNARDIAQLFPSYEKDIIDYAYVNRDIEKSDKVQFMKFMADHINNLLLKNLKQ